MSTAPTFPKRGIALLGQLAHNNSTAWFHAHRDEYRTLVQEPMRSIVAFVNKEMTAFAKPYVSTKKNPLSRPNRDTRFSKDKSPYRTDVSVVFPRRGKEKHEAAGFYFGVSPKGCEIVAGTYMPGPDQLKRLRRFFAAEHDELEALASERQFASMFGAVRGEQLKRVPRDFDAEHAAGWWLRLTQCYVARSLPASVVTSAGFAREIVASFRVATPFVARIDTALGNR